MITITQGIRGYKSSADRKRAIKMMIRSGRFNHFVCFRDVKSEFALQFGFAEWARERNCPYINW